MAGNLTLLESTFQDLHARREALAASFYDRLFTAFPETRALFARTDMAVQRRMFGEALSFLVRNVREPETLAETLKSLGMCHERYGVKAEHYPLVEGVLLETLAEALADRWTPELRDAWTDAFRMVTRLMLAGYTAFEAGTVESGQHDEKPFHV